MFADPLNDVSETKENGLSEATIAEVLRDRYVDLKTGRSAQYTFNSVRSG
jgi:hypothetical protein